MLVFQQCLGGWYISKQHPHEFPSLVVGFNVVADQCTTLTMHATILKIAHLHLTHYSSAQIPMVQILIYLSKQCLQAFESMCHRLWNSLRSETHWELQNMNKICICTHYQQHQIFLFVHDFHRGWTRVIGRTNKTKLCKKGGLLQCYLILPHLGQGPSSSKISRHI